MPRERNEKPKTASGEKPLDFIDQFRAQLSKLAQEKEASEKKAAEYLDKLRRLQADMENLQKITKRQVESVTKQASEGLLLKLLPILDALQQAGNIAHSGNQLPQEEIAVGLNMLFKQLTEILRAEGLEEIPAVGQPLDPEKHEVVSFVETDGVPENMVMEEVRRGYLLNGAVIRPSLVIVSRPKPSRENQIEETDQK